MELIPAGPLDAVSCDELAAALHDLYEYRYIDAARTPAPHDHEGMARKLIMIITANRRGETCLGCKMGMHAG